VCEDCIFSEGKSQEMGLAGVYLLINQLVPGAILVQLTRKTTDFDVKTGMFRLNLPSK